MMKKTTILICILITSKIINAQQFDEDEVWMHTEVNKKDIRDGYNIDSVYIYKGKLKDACQFENLRVLTLESGGNPVNKLCNNNLSGVTYLKDYRLNSEKFEFYSGFKNIEYLEIGYLNLDSIPKEIYLFSELKYLMISGNITSSTVNAELKELKTLKVFYCLFSEPLYVNSPLPFSDSLESLQLDTKYAIRLTDSTFTDTPEIKYLNIRMDCTSENLLQLTKLKKLEKLTLYLGSKNIEELIVLKVLKNLKEITIYGPIFSNDDYCRLKNEIDVSVLNIETSFGSVSK